MRWLFVAFVVSRTSVAAADRRLELMPSVGTTLTDRTVSPALAMSLAWERDPFSLPAQPEMNWRWLLGTFRWAPEATVQVDDRHTLMLGGVRLARASPWEPTRPDLAPILSDAIALRVGSHDGANLAVGAAWITHYQFGRDHGFAFQFGANTWREGMTWTLQLTASLAITVNP